MHEARAGHAGLREIVVDCTRRPIFSRPTSAVNDAVRLHAPGERNAAAPRCQRERGRMPARRDHE